MGMLSFPLSEIAQEIYRLFGKIIQIKKKIDTSI